LPMKTRAWIVVAVLAVGLLLAYAYVYRSEASKPDKKSYTMKGETTVVCGWDTMPYDTHADRVAARGTALDCGIFHGYDGKPRTGPMPPVEQ
jgi:hypothetical protein